MYELLEISPDLGWEALPIDVDGRFVSDGVDNERRRDAQNIIQAISHFRRNSARYDADGRTSFCRLEFDSAVEAQPFPKFS